MIKVLKDTLRNAETWPEADQEELAAAAYEITRRRSGVYHLSVEDSDSLRVELHQADVGDFASDEDVAAGDRLHMGV